MDIKGVASLLASPSRVRQDVTYVLLVAVVGAVILPILAPGIDHHALEKLPAHGHIYPGGIPVDHGHAYEAAHAHGNETADVDETGIVFLPPTDHSTGVSSFNIASVVLALSVAILTPSLLVRVKITWSGLPDRFTPLVETPPPQPA